MRKELALVVRLCSVAVIVSSCGGGALVHFTPAGPASIRPRAVSCTVQVFHDATPERPYVELGTIDYHHERHRTSAGRLRLEVALPEIEKRACAVGADALIDVRITEQRRLEWALFHASATAIRFEPR